MAELSWRDAYGRHRPLFDCTACGEQVFLAMAPSLTSWNSGQSSFVTVRFLEGWRHLCPNCFLAHVAKEVLGENVTCEVTFTEKLGAK